MKTKHLLIVPVLLGAAAPFVMPVAGAKRAAPTVLYVSATGSDTNSGTTLAAPLRTIQKAVDRAMPGDTVLVRGGTYRETVTTSRSGAPKARITRSGTTQRVRDLQRHPTDRRRLDPQSATRTTGAPMPWNYTRGTRARHYNSNQVFHNWRMMELAAGPTRPAATSCARRLQLPDSITFSKSDPL
jgi:hypothetical protein